MGYKPWLTEAQTASLIADYSAGLSWEALCAKYDRTSGGLTHILRRAGVTTSRRTRVLEGYEDVEKLTARVVDLYQTGHTALSIAPMLRISMRRVASLVRSAGIETRTKGSEKLTATQRREIAKRYAAGEHPKVVASSYDISPRTVQDAARYHGIRIRGIWETRERHSLRHDAFSELTPESAYWIGFLLTDASVAEKKMELTLRLATVDRKHIERFRDFLGYGGTISILAPRPSTCGSMSSGAVNISVRSAQIVSDLAQFGVVPRKSLTAKLADDRLLFDRDFWRGCIDGDGSVGWHHTKWGRYPYVSLCGAKGLVAQFRDYAVSVSTRTTATVRPNKTIFAVRLTGAPALPVIHELYDGAIVALRRKATTADEILAIHSNHQS